MGETDILPSQRTSPEAGVDASAQLYKPWEYLKQAQTFQLNLREARSCQRGPYNLASENPGDRIPLSEHDRLVISPYKTCDVSEVALPILRQPPSVKEGVTGRSTKRSSSLVTVRTTGETANYSSTGFRNGKRAPYQSLNPIRYRLFLDQLSLHKKISSVPEPSLLLSPLETSLLSNDKQRPPAAKPWIGFRYNLKRSDPVVFSPVLITNNDLLDFDGAPSLAESHRYKTFTQSGNKSMTASVPVLQTTPLNSSTILSRADESLLCGYNTIHTCKKMLAQSFSKRSSSTVTYRSLSTGLADAEHIKSTTDSPYDSILLEFADDVVPFAESSNHTPHQRALIKAQGQRIQRLLETQPDVLVEAEPPSFASYYVRSRRTSTGVSNTN